MPDTQQIIENIRAVLAATGSVPTAAVTNLAAAYAALCAETNARLRRCLEYLRQGLRSETIQLAETPPNLLEMAAALDFPEREQWESLCARNHLPLAQPLRLVAAQEINESYAAEAALHDVLVRHRLLALARAPLRERAAVLRDLARRDPVNPCWGREQRVFEAARLVEMRDEAAAAVAAHDGGRATTLLGELDDPGWTASVPERMRAILEAAAAANRAAQVVVQLRTLLPLMEQTVVEQNYEHAQAVWARWQTLVEQPHVAVPADVVQRAQPFLVWMKEETHRRREQRKLDVACVPLRDALAAGAPTDMLERLHRGVAALGLPLPPDLVQLYNKTLAARERARRLGRLRNASIAVALVLVVGSVASGMIFQNLRDQREQRWRAEISGAMDAGDLPRALELVQEMTAKQPKLEERPGFRELIARVNVADEADRERVRAFRQHLDAAGGAGAGRAAVELAAAEQFARTPEELAEVAAVRARISQAAARLRAEAERSFRGQLAFLVSEVAALDGELLANDSDAYARRLDADDAAVKKLRSSIAAGGMDDKLSASLKPVEDRLAAARQAMQEAGAERAAYDAVLHAAGSAADYTAALKTYAARFPESARGKAFAEALAQAPAWAAVEAWGAIVSGWSGVLAPSTAEDAGQRLAVVAEYSKQHSASPLAGDTWNYAQYLVQARDAAGPGVAWKQAVAQLMQNPLIQDVTAIKTVRGIYYFKGEPKTIKHTSLGATFPAILSNDAAVPTGVTVKETDILAPAGPSPQSILAKAVLEQLEAISRKDWETAPLALAAMVRDQKDLDPVLKVVMLSEVLKAGQAGGWRLDEPLKEPLARLEALGAEKVVWVNPNDQTAKAARPIAAAGVNALPALAEIGAQVIAARDQLFASLRLGIAGEGALFRSPSGWQIETRHPKQEGETAAIIAGLDPSHPEWRTIGKVQGGRWVLDDDAARLAPEGTMVFIRSGK